MKKNFWKLLKEKEQKSISRILQEEKTKKNNKYKQYLNTLNSVNSWYRKLDFSLSEVDHIKMMSYLDKKKIKFQPYNNKNCKNKIKRLENHEIIKIFNMKKITYKFFITKNNNYVQVILEKCPSCKGNYKLFFNQNLKEYHCHRCHITGNSNQFLKKYFHQDIFKLRKILKKEEFLKNCK